MRRIIMADLIETQVHVRLYQKAESSQPVAVKASDTQSRTRIISVKGRPSGFERLARWWSNSPANRLTVSELRRELMSEVTRYIDESVV
jgi:hypothetical protein